MPLLAAVWPESASTKVLAGSLCLMALELASPGIARASPIPHLLTYESIHNIMNTKIENTHKFTFLIVYNPFPICNYFTHTWCIERAKESSLKLAPASSTQASSFSELFLTFSTARSFKFIFYHLAPAWN